MAASDAVRPRSDRASVLADLDFGKVDSESELDLDRRFVRTVDFDRFLDPTIWLVLGSKGTGKSALFELFTKYEGMARSLAPTQLRSTWITAGTGFSDLSEVSTGDITELRSERGYEHERLWKLYIAVRAGLAISKSDQIPNGPLKDLLRALGERRDFRVGPLLKSLWKLAIGQPPQEVTVAAKGASVRLTAGNRSLDVVTLLQDAEKTLQREGKNLWILFDKIDEVFPADRHERLLALEGLIAASMSIRRTFPHIMPRIFLRSDLWREMQFTNKSHLTDKTIELRWTSSQIALLLLKRAVTRESVWEFVADRQERLIDAVHIEELNSDEQKVAIEAVLPASAYTGQNEAEIIDWIVARVTDGLGTVLPRESILLCNVARQKQLESGGPGSEGESLIGREAIRDAFSRVSEIRCEAYLAEFPNLQQHLLRFRGQTTASFSREDIKTLMSGRSPSGGDLLREMCDIGVIAPLKGDVATAQAFEVPRLYRIGLGLIIRGRP